MLICTSRKRKISLVTKKNLFRCCRSSEFDFATLSNSTIIRSDNILVQYRQSTNNFPFPSAQIHTWRPNL